MTSQFLARIDSTLRPILLRFPAKFSVRLYSSGRKFFLAKFMQDFPAEYIPPANQSKNLWGIAFRSGIMNAAGMFKNGEGYNVVARQGAGAYIAGTTTSFFRTGNEKIGIKLPFAPYPKSGAASNWLGLPNEGHAFVAKKLAHIPKIPGCPIGASVMSAPESHGLDALKGLVEGMNLYEKAAVDFIEMNESCPNVAHGNASYEDLTERLEFVSRNFLQNRTRNLPVIVKFSNDTAPNQVQPLLDILFSLGFDGVNFGNTSTAYAQYRPNIATEEQKVFDFFTQTFGGGISGKPLKNASLLLSKTAVEYAQNKARKEFHVIRTGGIENRFDIEETHKAGIALCQWYTGYFENFAHFGHDVYRALWEE